MVDTVFANGSGVDFLGVVIDRKDVEHMNIEPAQITLNQLLQDRQTILRFRGRLEVAFAGYDDDSRELYEISEVRTFVAALDRRFPFWFYFLNLGSDTLTLIILCLCRYSKKGEGLSVVDPHDRDRFILDHGAAVESLIERYLLPVDENEAIAAQIAAYFEGKGKPTRIQ